MSHNLRNAISNIFGEGVWGLGAAFVAPMTVLALVLKRYGASEAMIGATLAIQAGGVILPQWLGIYLIRSRKRYKAWLIGWHVVPVTPFLFLMAGIIFYADRLPDVFVRWSLLACFAGYYFSLGIIVAVWSDWLAHLFPPKIRGKVTGWAFGMASLLSMIGAAVAGLMIERFETATAYGLLYVLSGIFGILSMGIFLFVDDPARHEPDVIVHIPIRQLFAKVRHSLASPNFRAFLIGRLIATCGFSVVPFIAVYYSSEAGGGLSDDRIVGYGAAQFFGVALSTVALGYLGDHRGHRLGVIMGIILQIVTLAIMLFSAGTASCILAFAVSGMCMGAASITNFNILIETCPHDNRVAHITAGNLVLSPFTLAAPILGGLVARLFSLTLLFQLSMACSAVALVWILLTMKEPRTIDLYPESDDELPGDVDA